LTEARRRACWAQDRAQRARRWAGATRHRPPGGVLPQRLLRHDEHGRGCARV